MVEKEIVENTGANDEDSTATEPDEVADKIEEREEERAENTALTARRSNIARALEKIKSGTYGVCEISGETIEEDRLEANPAARTCKAHMGEEDALLA